VREAAKKNKGLQCTALLHHVTEGLLRDSFYSLQRGAAPGVDRVTWQQYEQGLEARIQDLHGRVHRGAYRAQPSRRVYIPKADGRQRPLGIAALEDKIVQQAVVTVLNAIYEEDFIGISYGFRPGRGAHDALDALTAGIVWKKVNWILDADIRGFFDNLDHGHLLQLLQRRVGDPRMLRLIQKWLKAGVSEDGEWSETKVGTPQGAVISPLLANIYLHYVLDQWVIEWRKRNAFGDLVIVRYADDVRHRIRAPESSGAIPGATTGTAARVRAGTASGKDAPDRVWAICHRTSTAEWGREAGNLQFPGFHAHLRKHTQDGKVHGDAEDNRQTYGSKAENHQGRTA